MIPSIEQILWLAFALGWGTQNLFHTMSYSEKIESDTSDEKAWGFGQVFPVILLALPVLSFAESYYGRAIPFARIVQAIRIRTQSCGTLLVRP